jgi:hypothetical protein
MKYQWTDWIEHVPGQELLPGTHGIFECVGRRNGGVPYRQEYTVTTKERGHPCWHLDNPNGSHVMILRYKLRSIAEEQTAESELEVSA